MELWEAFKTAVLYFLAAFGAGVLATFVVLYVKERLEK